MFPRFSATLALTLLLTGCASPPSRPVTVNLALINDFHGYLEPNPALFDQGPAAQPMGVSPTCADSSTTCGRPIPQTLVIGSGDLTSAQLRELLEQPWRRDTAEPFQVSAGFTYAWDARRPIGQRVVPGSVRLDGQALDDRRTYRLVVNSFLADGGDGATLLKAGSNRLAMRITDLEALERYLVQQDRQGRPAGQGEPAGRIRRQDG